MDAPLQGDTGGHTGAAPTNLHQIPLPAIISHVCPSAEALPATLEHGTTREMVGAAPVCPPERPRSGVSIRKRHIPIRKGAVSICKGRVPIRKGGVSIRKEHAPSVKAAFPFINDACSHQNMFVYLPMDAPSWGDTGAAPTNLHQIPLPPYISHVCPSASTSPATL